MSQPLISPQFISTALSESFQWQQSSLQRRKLSAALLDRQKGGGASLSSSVRWQRATRRGMSSLRELPAVCDGDGLGGSPGPGAVRLHFLHHVHSCRHAAKHNMPAIQPEHREQNYFYPRTSRNNSSVLPDGFSLAAAWILVVGVWSNRPRGVHHFYQELCSQLSADYTPPTAFPHTAAWRSSCGHRRGSKILQKQKVFQKVGVITERSCLPLCKKNDLAQILVVWTEWVCSPADIWLQLLLGRGIQAASSLAIHCSAVTLAHGRRLLSQTWQSGGRARFVSVSCLLQHCGALRLRGSGS